MSILPRSHVIRYFSIVLILIHLKLGNRYVESNDLY